MFILSRLSLFVKVAIRVSFLSTSAPTLYPSQRDKPDINISGDNAFDYRSRKLKFVLSPEPLETH